METGEGQEQGPRVVSKQEEPCTLVQNGSEKELYNKPSTFEHSGSSFDLSN